MIALSASLLWSSANLDMMIAGNYKRVTQAKMAANSGINHFVSLNIDYDALYSQSVYGDGIIIPMTQLSRTSFYLVEVDVLCCGPNRYIVKSTGYYRKGEKVISSYPVKATFLLE